MRISESIIEQLNSQADLVGMIRKHTTLKPAGREFKGCCPFHGEKTPSFYVNPETNLYYCFGCHAKGNPITFLKEYERLSFMEAVKYLSEQTGIELPKDDNHAKKTRYAKKKTDSSPHPYAPNGENPVPIAPPAPPQPIAGNMLIQDNAWQNPPQPAPAYLPQNAQEPQGDLYQLLENICQYYQFMLNNTPKAKQYFLDRGISEESITTFRLGYAPEGWQHLESVFSEDIEGLKILGLVRQSQKGRDFDLLRNRVIFPIKDKQGRVVGFAGRSLGDETPKYINSSESPIFQKQHILYGMYEARQQKASEYLMVEGYMDVIALYQAGIFGAVAPMGTAANETQIATLLRYHDSLTLCFDGDGAGQKAAWRTMEVAAPVLTDGKTLKFLLLPDQHDPDSFLRQHGAAAMQDELKKSLSLSEYIFQALSARFDLDKPEQKAAAMAQLRSFCELFPKGSSLRWWLNSDIYQKIKAVGRSTTSRFNKVDRANYTINSQDPTLQLSLCLLSQPQILADDPLDRLIHAAQLHKVHEQFAGHLARQDLTSPPLPTWASLNAPLLSQIIEIAKSMIQSKLQFDTEQAAHFIIAALPMELQDLLKKHWVEFAKATKRHNMQNLSPLFNEILGNVIIKHLEQQMGSCQNLVLSEIHKRRLQQLKHWNAQTNRSALAEIFDKSL